MRLIKCVMGATSVIAILCVLAACTGGGAPSAPTATPRPAATSAPTGASAGARTPAPAATPAATATAAGAAPANTPNNSVPTLAPNAPNTSFETAQVLDKPVKLSVKESKFYFKVDVPRGGIISSTLTLDAFSPAPAKLVLYDELQQYLKEVTVPPGRSAPLRYVFNLKGGGTTYLELSGNSSVTLQAVAIAPNAAGSGQAAGDDEDSALPIKPGSYTGLLADAKGDDVYLVDVPRTGGFLTVTLRTPDGNLKATVSDENRGYVGEISTDKNKPSGSTFSTLLKLNLGGNWYVAIHGEGAYTFTVAFASKNDAGSGHGTGDTADTAVTVNSATFSGATGFLDTTDYFKVPAALGRKVNVKYSGKNSLKVELHNADDNYIKDVRVNNGASVNLVEDSGDTGDYYIIISSGEGSYTVTLSK